MKNVYLIAGPNGAGKTTAAFNLLPSFINAKEYINADSIARALSPFNYNKVAIQAGKLMLERINELIESNKDFAFETTLAAKAFLKTIRNCKEKNYQINLIFLWLPSARLAVQRVKLRVAQGGHSIPVEIIKKRYKKGLENLFHFYMPKIDNLWVYDNSEPIPKLVAMQLSNKLIEIMHPDIWEKMQRIGAISYE